MLPARAVVRLRTTPRVRQTGAGPLAQEAPWVNLPRFPAWSAARCRCTNAARCGLALRMQAALVRRNRSKPAAAPGLPHRHIEATRFQTL